MTTRLLIAALAVLLVLPLRAARTFGDVLGRERVVSVIREETNTYVRQFQQMTKRKAEVAKGYHEAVADRIVGVESPEVQAEAQTALRYRYRLFLANLAGFVLATKQELVLAAETVKEYLNAAALARRCGEVPCGHPCENKEPCDNKCNACPDTERR